MFGLANSLKRFLAMGGPFLVFAIHFVFQEVAFRKYTLFEKNCVHSLNLCRENEMNADIYKENILKSSKAWICYWIQWLSARCVKILRSL